MEERETDKGGKKRQLRRRRKEGVKKGSIANWNSLTFSALKVTGSPDSKPHGPQAFAAGSTTSLPVIEADGSQEHLFPFALDVCAPPPRGFTAQTKIYLNSTIQSLPTMGLQYGVSY